MLMIAALLAFATAGRTTSVEEIDFAARRHTPALIAHGSLAETRGDRGTSAGEPLTLPETAPSLPARGSRFSTLFRARDHFDLTRYPARSVAKLFRLKADGTRAAEACTAQFIGPRHLVTAGHCLADRIKGVPHPGFELALGLDAGAAMPAKVVPVTRAWLPSDQLRLTDPMLALVTPERCSDFGVVEIAEPEGAARGWLGMRDEPAPGMLHRFSYPHLSAADRPGPSADVRAKMNPQALKQVADLGAKLRISEPDFSPANLYFEYGLPDEASGRFVADRNGYVLPGRSGSALLSQDHAIVALLSRGYNGTSYSCRLTADDIGLIQAILARQARPPVKPASA